MQINGDQMVPIPVVSSSNPHSFEFARDAIQYARDHWGQHQAQEDTQLLMGSRLINYDWSMQQCVFKFANNRSLYIYLVDFQIQWRVERVHAKPGTVSFKPSQQPLLELHWLELGITELMNPHTLLSKRIGSLLNEMFVNDSGLFVYFRQQIVLQFNVINRTDTDENILYVSEN